jgi:hypothetical protein
MNKIGQHPGAEKTKHKADQYALALAPSLQAAVSGGAVGLAAIASWLNKHQVATARGGDWRTETVRRVQKRLAELQETALAVRSRSEAQYARQERLRDRDRAARARNAKQRQELIEAGILKGE